MHKMKSKELTSLPNIGVELERQLNQIGVYTFEELKKLGAEQVWLKIQEQDKSACMNRLLAFEGAIQGVKKTMLPDEKKEALKAFYLWNKK